MIYLLEFEVLPGHPGLEGRITRKRIEYAKEFYGIEFLPSDVPALEIKRDPHSGRYTVNYTCGHCGNAANGIIVSSQGNTQWFGCPSCEKGSVANDGEIFPVPLLGDKIRGLPELIEEAYEEVRKSFSSKSYTACELMCRKILMNVGVHKGAKERLKFEQYIDHLVKNGDITNSMKPWVKKIRDNGNEAAHVINPPDPARANATLQFTALLLKNVYEPTALIEKDSEEAGNELASTVASS